MEKTMSTNKTVTQEQKDDPTYRTYLYNKVDGVIISQIVDATEAEALFEFGWRLSPAEFTDNEDLQYDTHFHAIASDMAQITNLLLNIELCDDRVVLRDIAENFLKLDFKKNIKTKQLKKMIIDNAKESGLLE